MVLAAVLSLDERACPVPKVPEPQGCGRQEETNCVIDFVIEDEVYHGGRVKRPCDVPSRSVDDLDLGSARFDNPCA